MPDGEDDSGDNVRAVWSEDELDRALAALRPARDPDKGAFTRARTEVLVAAGARVPSPHRRRWAWWSAAIATVTVVAASVLVVQTVQLGDRIPDATAEQLNHAAEKVSVVDEPLAPGQYRYVVTHAWWMSAMDDYSYLAENLLETWVPADQTQVWLSRWDVTGARKWLVGTEEEARAEGVRIDGSGGQEGELRAPCGDWYAAEEGREPCSAKGDWRTPDARFLAALPRDTVELYDRLRRDTAGRGRDAGLEMVVTVADVLRTGLVPADLRAALYRVLATIPGLQVTEKLANVDGRKGTAYGISADGIRHDVIVDPATGQFIGERKVIEKDFNGIPAGTVTGYTSLATAVVPAMGVRPAT